METLLICLLLLYNAYLVFYLLREKQQEGKSSPQANTTSPTIQAEKVEDIVGKSRFVMEKKVPQTTNPVPQAATSVEAEDIENNDVTFADETDKPAPARLPDDKLDEAFTHIQISDLPLEYGENELEDELPTTGFATGVSFEEIGEAVKIANSPVSTKDESYRAGQVFTELEGNEFFDQLTKSSSIRSKKITELMDYFLSNSISRDGDFAGEVVQLQHTTEIQASISGFDIRDFV
ncbi:MAG: hypothetical protein PHR83_11310 [Paludibacter sp.]|nr:hypothetical protein [Paludibacter sp.]